jgi:hypothetical protein
MAFNRTVFILEMKDLIEKAVQRVSSEKPDFLIFTASIWTDPDACVSSINFDSQANSDKKIESSNKWAKKYYEQYLAEGDLEQAKLFEPRTGRNCNPADFELRDFEEIKNQSMPNHWEAESNGRCWTKLEPALKEIGDYAFERIAKLNIHSNFELAVNGKLDWYQFTWPQS